MKNCLLAVLLFFFASACHKERLIGTEPGEQGLDYTPTPSTELTATEIIGYVTNPDQSPVAGLYYFNEARVAIMGNGAFYTGPVVSDKFNFKGHAEATNFLATNKSFPVTPSSINYVRVQMRSSASIGGVRNDAGGTFLFDNGGTITFGINSLYDTPKGIGPGYFGPDIFSDINLTYLNPESDEFALRLPAYLSTDVEGNRWFLKNYGGILFRMKQYNDVSGVDFYNGANADLQLPIPESMLAEAPDSIPYWKLAGSQWIAAGMAGKEGKLYKAKLASTTDHVFAVPVKGIYATIQVRSIDSATLTNTRVRVRQNDRVIAESVTDADGNAMCFVPSNEKLTVEVLPDEHIYSLSNYQFPINTITKSHTVRVTIPGSTKEITSLSGNVFNCNGKPVKIGRVRFLTYDNREYFFPVNEGKYASAAWMFDWINQARIQVTDYSDGTQGEIVDMNFFRKETQKLNLTTCPNANYLYCNYSVDNASFEMTDDAALPNVFITAVQVPEYGAVSFKTSNEGKGVNFTTWTNGTGVFGGPPRDLVVNGVSYMLDDRKASDYIYTRFDAAINGIIEGWFSVYYLDANGGSHNVKGNFRVKKMF